MYKIKREQLESREAQAIECTAYEMELLEKVLKDLNEIEKKKTGVEKRQLQAKKADLEIQLALNRAKNEKAQERFKDKFGSMVDPNDLRAARNDRDKDKGKTDKFSKWSGVA